MKKEDRKTNPNKVNQYTAPDPRQTLLLQYYLDPKSDTFSNYAKSGVKAGYSKEYSENLSSSMPKWLSENIGNRKFLEKAHKNLDIALDGGMDDLEKGGKQIQWKATEMSLKGLEKSRWSNRQELTGEDGGALQVNIVKYGNNKGSAKNK